jgi:hypothetical protein
MIGHGVEAKGAMYFGTHCAHAEGVQQAVDRM